MHIDDLRDREPEPPAVMDIEDDQTPEGVNVETGEITEPSAAQQQPVGDDEELNFE
ncbi:hypothetical protein D3C78_1897160 [compost metagenome]